MVDGAGGAHLAAPPDRHSSLGYLSPLEYESQHYDGITITNP